eukprot:2522451-Pleurochrysis_carterae.AAC.1
MAGADPNQPEISKVVNAADDAANDAVVDVDAATPATPALPRAGRHGTTYDLKCTRLRQKIDTQCYTINNLQSAMIYIEKTASALRERDYVIQEAASQKEGGAVAAEEVCTAYETNAKQLQAAASVMYKLLLKQLQEERDSSSD